MFNGVKFVFEPHHHHYHHHTHTHTHTHTQTHTLIHAPDSYVTLTVPFRVSAATTVFTTDPHVFLPRHRAGCPPRTAGPGAASSQAACQLYAEVKNDVSRRYRGRSTCSNENNPGCAPLGCYEYTGSNAPGFYWNDDLSGVCSTDRMCYDECTFPRKWPAAMLSASVPTRKKQTPAPFPRLPFCPLAVPDCTPTAAITTVVHLVPLSATVQNAGTRKDLEQRRRKQHASCTQR